MATQSSNLDLSASGGLTGQFLIAMPRMNDPRFARSVVYLCAHSREGAMGLVINKLLDSLSFTQLLEQLGIPTAPQTSHIRVHFGGPVESGRGFVLHTDDYMRDGSMPVRNGIALSATIDILKSISTGTGPKHALLALGYAGWGAGQLESEIQSNGWLTVPSDADLLFDDSLGDKWQRAMAQIGINLTLLSGEAGHA